MSLEKKQQEEKMCVSSLSLPLCKEQKGNFGNAFQKRANCTA